MTTTVRPWNASEWARVRRSYVLWGDCWVWQGRVDSSGYGRGRRGPGFPEQLAHVMVWEALHGPVPDGMQLDHTCHTKAVQEGTCQGGKKCLHRRCINPTHMEVVTPAENTIRSNHANRRITHCPKGHEYTEENTARRSGRRYCRRCERERKR